MNFTHECIHFDWFVVFLLITKCVLMLNSASHPNIYTKKFILKSFIIINSSCFSSSPYCMVAKIKQKNSQKHIKLDYPKMLFFFLFLIFRIKACIIFYKFLALKWNNAVIMMLSLILYVFLANHNLVHTKLVYFIRSLAKCRPNTQPTYRSLHLFKIICRIVLNRIFWLRTKVWWN